jgi:hypothetical protein
MAVLSSCAATTSDIKSEKKDAASTALLLAAALVAAGACGLVTEGGAVILDVAEAKGADLENAFGGFCASPGPAGACLFLLIFPIRAVRRLHKAPCRSCRFGKSCLALRTEKPREWRKKRATNWHGACDSLFGNKASDAS